MPNLTDTRITGHLGRNPRCSPTDDGQLVATFSVATNPTYIDQHGTEHRKTVWHRVVAYGLLAEVCQRKLKKGMKVEVTGRVRTRQWWDDDFNERTSEQIVAADVDFAPDAGNPNRRPSLPKARTILRKAVRN